MPSTTEETQAALLRQVAAQDRQALAQFYDQTAPLLFSTALRILGDAHETEEVIQDVFVQIWDKASTYDPRLGVALYWALSITRNRAIDRLRARQRRGRLLEQFQESSSSDHPASQLSGREDLTDDELAAIRAAVADLPTDQRQAIEMAFFGGLTHLEIAQALEQPLGTIKARIRRGMFKLRESLQPYV